VSDDNNRIIISRIQQRRGQKQDLPQPLRPAEFGFTTDTRQVFIGADPEDQTASYNKNLSQFEGTLNAQTLTQAIANNQVIAFTVPFIKYSKGKFNGTSILRQWEPEDARTSVTVQLACDHLGPTYNVFADSVTESYSLPVSFDGADQQIQFSYNAFDENPIRVGDALEGTGIPRANPAVPVTVAEIISDDTLTNNVTIRFTGFQNPIPDLSNTIVNFTQGSIINNITGRAFRNTDIVVHKNGHQIAGDPDNTLVDAPRSAYEYAFNASNVFATGTHSLTLRSAPSALDDITVAYYSNAAIVQALEGVQSGDGNRYITNNVRDPSYRIRSFYDEYNLPEFLQLDPELIRLSTTTGLGFIGLERKHVLSTAFGEVIENPSNVSLGDLMFSRLDQELSLVGDVSLVDGNNRQVYQANLVFASENVFSEITEANADTTYRYNRITFAENSNVDLYIQKSASEVIGVDESNSTITFEVPGVDFEVQRDATVSLTTSRVGNQFGNANSEVFITVTMDTAGILPGDYVRVLDTSGNVANCELHDICFQVQEQGFTSGSFEIVLTDADAERVHPNNAAFVAGNVSFTENNDSVAIVNHGGIDAFGGLGFGVVDEVVQLYTPKRHFFEVDPGNVYFLNAVPITPVNVELAYATEYSYDVDNSTALRDQDQKTILVRQAPGQNQFEDFNFIITGEYFPEMPASISNLAAIPVLAINLSSAITVRDALAIVNTPTATVKVTGSSPLVEDLFPQLDFLPGTTDQLILTQDPSVTSIGTGGIEFRIFDDPDTDTLQTLGFEARRYGRQTDTVRAKLEQWLNKVVADKNQNIFSRVMTIGSVPGFIGPNQVPLPITYTDYELLPNLNPPLGGVDARPSNIVEPYKMYRVLIDEVFQEVQFCSRQEASNFNTIVNRLYTESLFDRRLDRFEGTRGLLNLKDNIEILTRESSILFGEREVTFSAPFALSILNEQPPFVGIQGFSLETAIYNAFIIDYSIIAINNPLNQYSRIGTMYVESRGAAEQLNDPDAVIIKDEYASQWDINSPPIDGSSVPIGPSEGLPPNGFLIYEPKFGVRYTSGRIEFFLEEYPELLLRGAAVTTHNINADLAIKYSVRRWSSTDV
jgi:hypothetical protein